MSETANEEPRMRDGMMKTREAAAYLGIAETTLAMWCSAKRLPYYKPSKERMFKKEDLDRFIENSRIEAQ